MAVTGTIYNEFKERLMMAGFDLANDTIKVALCTNTYSPDIDTHDAYDDLTNEVSGTGYSAGGEALTTPEVTEDTTDDEGVFDADNVTWTGADFTARYAVIYKDSGVESTSYLIGYIDFGEDKTASGGDFTITWDAEGIVNIG